MINLSHRFTRWSVWFTASARTRTERHTSRARVSPAVIVRSRMHFASSTRSTRVHPPWRLPILQVKNPAGEWISAPPVPGTFVCNIGDMLKVWSNGIYESTLHRVVNNSPKYRVSVAFFYEPNFDTAAEPLEFCREKTTGVLKYQRVVYGEHLVSKEPLESSKGHKFSGELML